MPGVDVGGGIVTGPDRTKPGGSVGPKGGGTGDRDGGVVGGGPPPCIACTTNWRAWPMVKNT